MHGVSTETLYINAMVEEDVTIVPIVVKHFQIVRVLQIFLEFHDNALSICIVINEQSWTIAKVYIRTYKDLSANDSPIPDRTLLLRIYVDSLSIPCMYPLW